MVIKMRLHRRRASRFSSLVIACWISLLAGCSTYGGKKISTLGRRRNPAATLSTLESLKRNDVIYLELKDGRVLSALYDSHDQQSVAVREKRSSPTTTSFDLSRIVYVERAKVSVAGSAGVLAVSILALLTFGVIGLAAGG